LIGQRNPAARQINSELVDFDQRFSLIPGRTANVGPDARHQFTGGKRLGQVIIRASVQGGDLIAFLLSY